MGLNKRSNIEHHESSEHVCLCVCYNSKTMKLQRELISMN